MYSLADGVQFDADMFFFHLWARLFYPREKDANVRISEPFELRLSVAIDSITLPLCLAVGSAT